MSQAIKGVGLGLRPAHIHHVLSQQPSVAWFEVHICNYLSGIAADWLAAVSESYPLSFHGVNLNLGGVDALDKGYLGSLKKAIDRHAPALVSEHACFTSHKGQYFHDLLPLPYTEEAVAHMADRVRQVQDFLGREISIENISRYYRYAESQLSEAEFLAAVAEQSGCGLLVDLNNAYVNQQNLGESVDEFVNALPAESITEVHLAGFSKVNDQLIDTHAAPVSDEVWALFQRFSSKNPGVPCLIEWDSELPAFEVLEQQLHQAEAIVVKASPSNQVTVAA